MRRHRTHTIEALRCIVNSASIWIATWSPTDSYQTRRAVFAAAMA